MIVGGSIDEAREKRARLDKLVHADSAIAALSVALGWDVANLDPDAPLPEIPESNASKGNRGHAIAIARREGLTVRQLALRLGGYAGLAFVGTPRTIADEMEEWREARAADGFNVMFPYLPAGLDDVVEKLIPELQRAGCSVGRIPERRCGRRMGLARPGNRFFPQ